LRLLSLDDYKVIGGFKSNVYHERRSAFIVDVASTGEYFITLIPNTNKAALFSVDKKEILYKLGRHQGEIESVAIDPNNRYCVTCGQDGKAFVWSIKTARLAFSMPPHADYVTCVAFSPSGQWVATGSFDRTINLLNLATMKQPLKLIGHSGVVVGLLFLPDIRLLSAQKEGDLIVWDIQKGRLLKRLPKMNDTITALCISSDKRFVFVGTKLGYIGLYDMQSMELVKQRYLKESEEITSLAFIENDYRLAVGTIEGNIRFYSLFGDQEHYMELLKTRQYKVFYQALDNNPILTYSKPYEIVEKVWEEVLLKARLFLEKGEKQKAKELFGLFEGVVQKNSFIAHVLRDYEKYAQFQLSVNEGRLPLAYSLAKQYVAFQDSEPYRKMEAKWKKLFAKAQEIILTPNGEEQARALVAPYRGISDKTILIQQLFADKRLYEYFKKVIASRNFIKFFELVKNHPFLKEFSEYTAVMEYADKLYIQTVKNYRSGELQIAKKASEILVFFPDYSAEATEMLETIKVKHLFFDAITSENYINAFAYLSSYPLLYDTAEAKLLEGVWNKAVDSSLPFVLKGDIEGVKKHFEFYLSIAAKYASMATVFAQAYSVQLEQKLRAKVPMVELENGIRNYVGMFGMDEYIVYFFTIYKNEYPTTTDLKMLKQGFFETWNPAMAVSDICTKNG
jgi:WD40 repeat protein